MKIMVSINCITYNHENYISDALDSFLMQKTNFDYEIIIGEDCSNDNTKKIVEEYMEKFPEKIRLITSDENVGWRKNIERILQESKGKYIAICEGDDFWTDSYKLQKQLDYMENHPECSLCFHASTVVDARKVSTNKEIRPYKKSGKVSTKDIITGGGEFCPTPSLFFPKKFTENPPDFYLKAHVGDYAVQMWLASQGDAYYIDEFMAAYRTGVEGSWTSNINSSANLIEKIINGKRDDMNLLDGFNKYTKFIFLEEIEKTKTKKEFEILLLQNKVNEVRQSKYKANYKILSRSEKLKLYLRAYFPKLYSTFAVVKSKIRNLILKDYKHSRVKNSYLPK